MSVAAEPTLDSAKARSHPLRLALLDLLRDGPRTSAEAASELGTNTGATSFHLRQLARFGLAEPAPGGRGRERPWRLVEASGDEAMDARDDERWARFAGRAASYPPAWRRQSRQSFTVYLTPAELDSLNGELFDCIAAHFDREGDPSLRPRGARPVAVQTRLFPDFEPRA